MPSFAGNYPFGIRDIKLMRVSGTPTQVDLPAARQLSFNLRMVNGELRGDDALVAVASYADAVEWSLEAGGIDLDAYGMLVGSTVVSSGTTPNRTYTLSGAAGTCMPWIKIYGKAVGDDCTSDIHVKLLKAKVTNLEGQFQDGEFYVTKCDGLAIDGGSGIWVFVQNETAAALPAS